MPALSRFILLCAACNLCKISVGYCARIIQLSRPQSERHLVQASAKCFHRGQNNKRQTRDDYYIRTYSNLGPMLSSSPDETVQVQNPSPHHIALRTRDIDNAIKFYSLLGFEVEAKFRAGPAKAAWLNQPLHNRSDLRLELIEVPQHILKEQEGRRKRAPNGFLDETLLGFNHLALDVTHLINSLDQTTRKEDLSCGCDSYGLTNYIDILNKHSLKEFGKTLRIAMQPKQSIVGQNVYELAFIYDADGAIVELLHYQKTLETPMVFDGWEPWKGETFENFKS